MSIQTLSFLARLISEYRLRYHLLVLYFALTSTIRQILIILSIKCNVGTIINKVNNKYNQILLIYQNHLKLKNILSALGNKNVIQANKT